MKSTTVVAELMKDKGISMARMAEKMGYKTPSCISDRIYNKHDMRADILAKFLDELDCELVIRSKLKDHREWIVTSEE